MRQVIASTPFCSTMSSLQSEDVDLWLTIVDNLLGRITFFAVFPPSYDFFRNTTDCSTIALPNQYYRCMYHQKVTERPMQTALLRTNGLFSVSIFYCQFHIQIYSFVFYLCVQRFFLIVMDNPIKTLVCFFAMPTVW